MARQGGNLHHEKPPGQCGTRRNSYETGARGLQRGINRLSFLRQNRLSAVMSVRASA